MIGNLIATGDLVQLQRNCGKMASLKCDWCTIYQECANNPSIAGSCVCYIKQLESYGVFFFKSSVMVVSKGDAVLF